MDLEEIKQSIEKRRHGDLPVRLTHEELSMIVTEHPILTEEQLLSLDAQPNEWLKSTKAYYFESETGRVRHYQSIRGQEDRYKVLKGSED